MYSVDIEASQLMQLDDQGSDLVKSPSVVLFHPKSQLSVHYINKGCPQLPGFIPEAIIQTCTANQESNDLPFCTRDESTNGKGGLKAKCLLIKWNTVILTLLLMSVTKNIREAIKSSIEMGQSENSSFSQ